MGGYGVIRCVMVEGYDWEGVAWQGQALPLRRCDERVQQEAEIYADVMNGERMGQGGVAWQGQAPSVRGGK